MSDVRLVDCRFGDGNNRFTALVIVIAIVIFIVIIIVIEAQTAPGLQLVDQVRKEGSKIFPALKLKTSRDKNGAF